MFGFLGKDCGDRFKCLVDYLKVKSYFEGEDQYLQELVVFDQQVDFFWDWNPDKFNEAK